MTGASLRERAGGPSDLSRSASQPKALIPSAIGNIHFIERPGKSAIEQRLSAKYLALLTRVYRYRRIGDFHHSLAAGHAADVVLDRLRALNHERLAA